MAYDGFLGKNKYKKKENHPDVKAYLTLDRDYRAGEKVEFVGWKRQKGEHTYLGLKISAPFVPKGGAQAGVGQGPEPMRNDDLPF